jgi:hypothetical protein
MRTLAHCGKEADAQRKAEELLRRRPKSVPLLLDAARCYAVSAGIAATPETRRRCLERAVSALRTATGEGYKDGLALETDPELASLREAKSFRDLLDGLAGAPDSR